MRTYRTLQDVIKRLVRIDRILCCCSGCDDGVGPGPGQTIQENFRGITENINEGSVITEPGTMYYFKATNPGVEVELPEIGNGLNGYLNVGFVARIKNSAQSTQNITIKVGTGGDDTIENAIATTKTVSPGHYFELVGHFDAANQIGTWVINAAYNPAP